MPRYLPRKARQERQIAFADALVANQYRLVDTVLKMGFTQNYNSAHVIAYRLLHSVPCEQRLKYHRKRSRMTADDVLNKLSKVASLDAEFKGSDIVKCNELLAKHHGLIRERIETTDTTERDTLKSVLASQIESAASDDSVTVYEAELALQQRLSDETRRSYDSSLDPRKVPHIWPSGLITQPVAPDEIAGEM